MAETVKTYYFLSDNDLFGDIFVVDSLDGDLYDYTTKYVVEYFSDGGYTVAEGDVNELFSYQCSHVVIWTNSGDFETYNESIMELTERISGLLDNPSDNLSELMALLGSIRQFIRNIENEAEQLTIKLIEKPINVKNFSKS